ncbi:hypothetical protein [Acetivibrio straminisolvens]|uniref:hypothetical protein n=1 Tax=Acetivibrio straminisolvens TaxID=253314 RepID=UPI00223F7CFB|nr:hypothetical protein [Acetivibrio straminisolvens]
MKKQHLLTIESEDAEDFNRKVNAFLTSGYKVTSTHIRGVYVGTCDESSIYQAILLKDEYEYAY